MSKFLDVVLCGQVVSTLFKMWQQQKISADIWCLVFSCRRTQWKNYKPIEQNYCLLWGITLATVDVTISCIIKVGRIQFFGTVKTCQTSFMVQTAFGHNFFCFIHHSMAFWTCFKTSLWTFDSCCFQRWGIIRPIFKVLNIFNIARFAVDFLLK